MRAMSAGNPRDALSLLRDPSFARLAGARLVSTFGSAMTPIALPFAVLDDLRGNAQQVGLLVGVGSAMQVATLLLGGALADRGSRQRQMIGADSVAALAQGAVALLLLTHSASFGAIAALVAVASVAIALHGPAHVGLVPLVAPRERLAAANALLGIANSSAYALGAASAGVIAATAGAGAALAIDAGSFAVSALLVTGIRAAPQARSAGESLIRELREGFREFTAHTWLWTIVVQFSVMLMGWFGSFAVLGPVIAKASLGGVEVWARIVGIEGAGLIAGGLLALRVHFARPMLAATLFCFPAALLPTFLALEAPWTLCAAAGFAAGVGFGAFGALWNTELHKRVAPEALSRVSAYDAMGSIALVPVGEALAGFGAVHAGVAPSALACAALIVLPTAAVLAVRDVRQMRA
jgi:MFS family permease